MKDNMKIALIMPKQENGFSQTTIPLGLSYIAAVLEKEGFNVTGYNLNVDTLEENTIKNLDMVGIYSTTSMFPSACKLAESIKQTNPDLCIVLGGPHAAALPRDVLVSTEFIDVCVIGEGEFTMKDIALSLVKESNFSSIAGLAYKKDSEVVINPPRPILRNLDQLPFPAKHRFNDNHYPDKKKAYGDIIASRGCPYKCTNCKPGLDYISPYRRRSPQNVVDEIEYLIKNYGVRHFTFSDSELAGPKKWILDFCSEIHKKRLKITFVCNARTDRMDIDMLKALKKAGCIFIGYGVESGSQQVIDEILQKGISLVQTQKIFDTSVEVGIGTGAWFMVGIPGETWNDAIKTIQYAKKLNASIIEVNIATPFPGSGFYYICKKNGWPFSENWELFNEKRTAMIETQYLSRDQVLEIFDRFRAELKKSGWKSDKTGTRFYHPHFLRRTVRMGFKKVLHRGIQIEDFKRLFSWLH